jgi:type IV pilus assembly protein PilE
MNGRQRGFTLIELVVTMAIVALLAAIAYPSYINYVRRGNRTDATRNMVQMAQALERCYSQAFTYAGCTAVPAGTSNSTQGYYTITVAIASASQYTLTAVPNGTPQSGDAPCQTFTLSSAGVQGALDGGGADNTGKCWGSN